MAWLRWVSLTGGGDIDKATFSHFFPELDDQEVLGSIFHAFDKLATVDSKVSFVEFVRGLSVMVRGDAAQRAERTPSSPT